MTDLTRDFLGIGWKFPLQVTPAGRIAQARYEQRIEESIFLILSTAPGERPMLPDFGCGIHDLVFERNNPATVAQVAQSVRLALTAHEPRIDVLDIDVQAPLEQPSLLLVRISYRVRSNNAVGNMVYPFYIREVA
ncbi:MAG: baseplate protein [Acidobacteria bacterium]|nr:MAG: baseplate protein [Acidobacteriota bacterium]